MDNKEKINVNNENKISNLMEKLKEMQERIQHINSTNYSNHTTQLDMNNFAKNFSRDDLLNKLNEIREKRIRLENRLKNNKVVTKNTSSYKDMEFIAERGYSKKSYLQIVQYIEIIKETLFKIKSTPNLKRIITQNLLLKEDMLNILNSFEDLAVVIGVVADTSDISNEKTDELIEKENANNLLLKNIEKRINDFSFLAENKKTLDSLSENSDIINSIDKELSLINSMIDNNRFVGKDNIEDSNYYSEDLVRSNISSQYGKN